jgi:hypothetical protein
MAIDQAWHHGASFEIYDARTRIDHRKRCRTIADISDAIASDGERFADRKPVVDRDDPAAM